MSVRPSTFTSQNISFDDDHPAISSYDEDVETFARLRKVSSFDPQVFGQAIWKDFDAEVEEGQEPTLIIRARVSEQIGAVANSFTISSKDKPDQQITFAQLEGLIEKHIVVGIEGLSIRLSLFHVDAADNFLDVFDVRLDNVKSPFGAILIGFGF